MRDLAKSCPHQGDGAAHPPEGPDDSRHFNVFTRIHSGHRRRRVNIKEIEGYLGHPCEPTTAPSMAGFAVSGPQRRNTVCRLR